MLIASGVLASEGFLLPDLPGPHVSDLHDVSADGEREYPSGSPVIPFDSNEFKEQLTDLVCAIPHRAGCFALLSDTAACEGPRTTRLYVSRPAVTP